MAPVDSGAQRKGCEGAGHPQGGARGGEGLDCPADTLGRERDRGHGQKQGAVLETSQVISSCCRAQGNIFRHIKSNTGCRDFHVSAHGSTCMQHYERDKMCSHIYCMVEVKTRSRYTATVVLNRFCLATY